MANYETTVEVTVKVLFEGTEDQFNALTETLLNEEAVATVKSLLPAILTTDPTFEIESGSFHRTFYSEAQLADAREGKAWAKAPTAVLRAELPEPEEV